MMKGMDRHVVEHENASRFGRDTKAIRRYLYFLRMLLTIGVQFKMP
jgi:hypothetical protein